MTSSNHIWKIDYGSFVSANVSHGNIVDQRLYLLFSRYILQNEGAMIAAFPGYTAIREVDCRV